MFTKQITARTQLQLLEGQHAAQLFQLTDANRAHLRQWLPWLDGTTEEKDTAAFIASMLRTYAETGAFTCGIWHDETLCDVIGYNQLNRGNQTASLGYWLSKSHEGKGIRTACCRAWVAHAFDEYQLNRLVIAVASGNERSQAIPQRLGFRKEGGAGGGMVV